MPTYEYRCDTCDRNFDVVQSFHDDPLTACPTCESPVRKVFGSVGIVFKGSGFYKTDSRDGKSKAGVDKADKADKATDGKAASGSEGGSTASSASGSGSGGASSPNGKGSGSEGSGGSSSKKEPAKSSSAGSPKDR